MPLFPLALAAGLLPLAAINISYVLAAHAGQVPWCLPYIDSCTSISATGRLPPAAFVFKGLMIPAAVLLVHYWILNACWLRRLGCQRHSWHRLLVILGLLAGCGLIIYSTLLGSIGPEYRGPRRTGVIAFFGATYLAQLIITWLLHERQAMRGEHGGLLFWLLVLMLLDLLLGLVHVLLGIAAPRLYETVTNAFAWNFTLLLCLHVLLTAELWRRTRWRLSFNLD